MNSIIFNPHSDYCYVCGKRPDDPHELIGGSGNRQNSINEGLKVPICRACHDKAHLDPKITKILRAIGQLAFMQMYLYRIAQSQSFGNLFKKDEYEVGPDLLDSVESFREIFGKTFL